MDAKNVNEGVATAGVADRAPSIESVAATSTGGPFARLLADQKREIRALVGDVVSLRGLMSLMMKNRNGGTWTVAEKAELLTQLRTLSRVSPCLLFLLLPGSVLLLPVYAWWLDRRRKPRNAAQP